MNAIQLKMALGALGITGPQAAKMSGVSSETVSQIETGQPIEDQASLDNLRRALESAGIEFITENGDVGVILRGGPVGDPDAAILVENLTSENDE
jgi:transcriptional regulator with XRE-family HTH domain